MMRDLIKKLTLLEAEVKPGERKEISFRIKKLNDIASKLEGYRRSASNLRYGDMPPSMKDEVEAMIEKLEIEIEKVNKAYTELFNKSTRNDRPVKMDNLFNALAKNCKDIIKVYQELNGGFRGNSEIFMYRGIRSREDAVYGKPFDARKPKDSSVELAELMNDALKEKGFVATRDNSMFVSGDRSQASGYGYDLYIMFPVDGFKYTWSKNTKDLVLDNSKKYMMYDKRIISLIKRSLNNMRKKHGDDVMKRYFMGNLDEVLSSEYRMSSDIDAVERAVRDGYLSKRVGELLKNAITADSIVDSFEFTQDDLFAAIKSRKEIYIRGPYYAVNTKHMGELINFLRSVDTSSVELPESYGEAPDMLMVGDIVKVKNGLYKGSIGTINYMYSGGDEADVTFNTGEGDKMINTDQLELYKLPDGTVPPKFQEKDVVKAINPKGKHYGKIGSVYYVNASGKIEVNSDGNYFDVYPHELAIYDPNEIEPPEGFAIGDKVTVTDPESTYYGDSGKINGFTELGVGKTAAVIDFNYYKNIAVPITQLKINAGSEEIADPSTIKIGDTIQVSNPESSKYGEEGVVRGIEVNSEGKKVVTVDFEYSKKFKTFLDWVEKIESTQKNFAPGDRVKVLSIHSILNGKIGKIESGPDSDGDYLVVSKDGEVSYVQPNKLVKVEDQDGFKPGDKVKIKDNVQSMNAGKIGEIVLRHGSSDVYDVKVGDLVYEFSAGEFEKAESEPAKSTAIQVGDIVKINDMSSDFYGEVGEIENGPDGEGDYAVIFNNGDNERYYFQAVQLDKVDEPKSGTKFAVDDIVKITGPSAYNNNSYVGYGGTITSISDDGKFAGVQLDPDTILTYDTSNLTKGETDEIGNLTWEPEPEAKASIKVGDTVKNIKPGHPHEGQTGVVKTVYSSGNVGLVYDEDGSQAIDPMDWLEKVDSSAQAEPESTEQSELAVGDRVEVTSMFPSLIGMTGKVTWSSPGQQFVSVQLDNNTEPSSFPKDALKKIKTPNTTETPLQIGDTVKINTKGMSIHDGETAVVQVFDHKSDTAWVKLDDGTALEYFASELTKVADAEKPLNEKIKQGDIVKVTNPALSTYNKTGTVSTITDDGWVIVNIEGLSNEAFLKPASLKIIGNPNTPSAPSTSTAPDSEVTKAFNSPKIQNLLKNPPKDGISYADLDRALGETTKSWSSAQLEKFLEMIEKAGIELIPF